ncbi:DNA topoisomerase I [Nostoc linckia z18]|uniref:DNA topoisomerase 1 n=2 Tax=Nostoc linckia TaxID=92942 RepID=A0A9Q6EHZ8_NOSLI|nr:type I DNA topoisomerase [Nostoc linckia]PHK30458.1 DNA topoisomerase I [Nostoc linckia z15]PHK39966.1 DNA topoisomerase I [Nostoc linckia z16]PHJ57121.1 DNA topoisomerase I [Nostoc linckia z2]PHJ64290.1 DNA topoisomerase I [Nostoc linckia z1]PHJ70968.1 DNA topoisomerase I [Nostoc linckia z3]
MPKRLLVVESPGKVKKLSQILGSEWKVLASCGHIRELSNEGEDSLGFSMDGSRIQCNYIPRDQRAKETIQKLKAALKQVDEVVIATDPDREGETIAWHIKEVLGLKEPKRVIYTEITASAVREAIAKPRKLDLNLVGAGQCRDCLDKLVGYKGSPLVWALKNGAKSVGRVQSATLHLICQREQEIQTFVPQDYWSVWVDYAEGFRAFYKGTVNSEADTPEQKAEADDDAATNTTQAPESKRILSEAEANRLVEEARRHPHQVIKFEGKIVHRQPPPPFTTSTLQQAAGSKLRFSPDKTMQVAQKLYEAGLITYMRTDSVMLSPEFCASARQWLEQNDPQNVPQSLAKHRSAKSAQEAHEAIRPTDVFRPSAELRIELPADDFNLYVMIWKRAIASQCRAAQLRKTQIITQSGNLLWLCNGQVIEFYGYARYWNNLSKDTVIPQLQQGQILTLKDAQHEKKRTQPPPRYSEPKLVQLMERKGIGRPSTYAPTVATLKKRDYVQLTKDSLQPTALGLEVDAFLQKALPDLLEAEFTAKMEDALDAIAIGKQSWQQYLSTWNQEYFAPALAKAKTVAVNTTSANKASPTAERKYETSKTRCPECQNFLAKIKSSKLKKKYFLKCVSGCENVVLFWSDLSKTWEVPRNKVSKEESLPKAATKLTSYSCPVCKKPLEEYSYIKEGQNKTMLRCSNPQSRQDKKHQQVAYFSTQKGWWSPKFGELN